MASYAECLKRVGPPPGDMMQELLRRKGDYNELVGPGQEVGVIRSALRDMQNDWSTRLFELRKEVAKQRLERGNERMEAKFPPPERDLPALPTPPAAGLMESEWQHPVLQQTMDYALQRGVPLEVMQEGLKAAASPVEAIERLHGLIQALPKPRQAAPTVVGEWGDERARQMAQDMGVGMMLTDGLALRPASEVGPGERTQLAITEALGVPREQRTEAQQELLRTIHRLPGGSIVTLEDLTPSGPPTVRMTPTPAAQVQEIVEEQEKEVATAEEVKAAKKEFKPTEARQAKVGGPGLDAGMLREALGRVLGKKMPEPSKSRLTERQVLRLAELNEREKIGRLDEKGYAEIERLEAIRDGEPTAKRMSPAETEKELQDALKMIDELEGTGEDTEVKNQLKAEVRGGLSVEEARRAAQSFGRWLPGADRVLVIGSDQLYLLPVEIRSTVDSLSAAFYIKSKDLTVVLADRHDSQVAVWKSLLHEVLVHKGFWRLLSPQERLTLLQLVGRDTKEWDDIRKLYGPAWADARAHAIYQGYSETMATGYADLKIAEEVIARKAESWDQKELPFIRRIIALVRRALRRIFAKSPRILYALHGNLSDNDYRQMFADMVKGFQGQVSAQNQPQNLISDVSFRLDEALEIEEAKQAKSEVLDLGGLWRWKMARLFYTPLQIASRYGDFKPVRHYMSFVQKFWNTKMGIVAPADEVVHDWRKLGKEEARKLSRLLLDVTMESDELGRRLTKIEILARMEKAGMGKEGQELYWRVDKFFTETLTRLERGLVLSALRESHIPLDRALELTNVYMKEGVKGLAKHVSGEQQVVLHRARQIQKEFFLLREKNYFPLERFGRYAVIQLAKPGGEVGPKGERFEEGRMMRFETFESRWAQKARYAEMKAAGANVKMYLVEQTPFQFIGMPPSLLEDISNNKELKLTQGQKMVLRDMFIRRSPGRAYLKHLTKRKGTAGFSEDAMRVFSHNALSVANHLARIENYMDMDGALTEMRKAKQELIGADDDSTVISDIHAYFSEHFNYIMNPTNDLAKLRAIGFLWYLGAVPKSALINLTQVPMVTYPYLAQKYGDGAAVRELMRAARDVRALITGSDKMSEDDRWSFERGINEGLYDESFAGELAAIEEGQWLGRYTSEGRALWLNKVSYVGTYMFRMAEKFNRVAAGTAAYRLARKQGLEQEAAWEVARDVVQTTQFEYGKWNRPLFMRGPKSAFFLFFAYMQHMAFLLGGKAGGGTALRAMAILFLMSGMQGLPFAEHFADLYDFLATKMKEKMGMKDPYTSVKETMRGLAEGVKEGSSDLFMHGLSRYFGLGPLHLLEAFGVPVPKTDVSGSLGMGQVLPGVREMMGPERDPDRKLVDTMVSLAGPLGAMAYNWWRLVMADGVQDYKAWERAMPNAVKNALQAARYAGVSPLMGEEYQGKEETRTGARVREFENWPGRVEALAKAAGFSPTGLNQEYEKVGGMERMKSYWHGRRTVLMQDYGWVYLHKDREAMADLRAAIKEFNDSIPSPTLRITREGLERSVKQKLLARKRQEAGLPQEKMFAPLVKGREKLYPVEEAAG